MPEGVKMDIGLLRETSVNGVWRPTGRIFWIMCRRADNVGRGEPLPSTAAVHPLAEAAITSACRGLWLYIGSYLGQRIGVPSPGADMVDRAKPRDVGGARATTPSASRWTR